MIRYETLLLTVPEITNTESSTLESYFTKAVEATKGKVISYDRWGKYRLAYPVNKNEYGVYYLARFEVPATEKDTVAGAIKAMCTIKYNTIIMRYMTNVLDAKQTLEYQRPTPLDEAPRGVDEFLKENKMEGLLAGKRDARNPRFAQKTQEESDDILMDEQGEE